VRGLADAAHVTPGQISRYEHGRDRISHERVTEFARILHIKSNDLYQPPGSRLQTRAERVQKAIRAARATLARCHADEFEFRATWAEERAAVVEAVRGFRELGEALELQMQVIRALLEALPGARKLPAVSRLVATQTRARQHVVLSDKPGKRLTG
jgi:hypothetical protein